MWLYWDWETITKKYVKHFSRILFLFLSVFLIISINTKASFDVLNVYNFTSKRPELVEIYPIIIIPALPHLQEALLSCLYIVPILILITWIPDAKNIKLFSMLYNFALILFGLVVLVYMLGIIFFLKSTNWWFIYFITVILLIVGTLIISHLYYKNNKEAYVTSKKCKILLAIIVVFSLCLEIFLAYPKVIESKKALNADYERVCYNITYNFYGDIFAELYDPDSNFFHDIREDLQNGSKAYIILNFINLYSSEENNFSEEEIIECYNNLETSDLNTKSHSWNRLLQLFDANNSAALNSGHLVKYNIFRSPLGFGYTSKHVFYENVLRRLNELGYTQNIEVEYIDKKVVDDACKYVYDIFESGLFEPIDEVTLSATYANGEYTLTTNEDENYFIHIYTTNDSEDEIRVRLYHSVGYYFDENTVINVDGIENYNISDIEFELEYGKEYVYADMNFSIYVE